MRPAAQLPSGPLGTPNASDLLLRAAGVTPNTTICGGWTTGWRIAAPLDSRVALRAALRESRPDPPESTRGGGRVVCHDEARPRTGEHRRRILEAPATRCDVDGLGLPGRIVDRAADPVDRGRCAGERDRPEVCQVRDVVPHSRGFDDPLGGAPLGGGALRRGRALIRW